MSDIAVRRFSVHAMAEAAVQFRFRLAGLEQRQADLGRASLRYWVGGNGPPLMLLHGFGGDASWAWHAQVRTLARRHTLLIPDLVWFGGSDSGADDRSLYFQAEMQAALAESVGWDRYDLCGISYGGLVAFTLTAMYGDRVRRLCLVDSPGPVYDDRDHHHILDSFGVNEVADVVIPQKPEDVRRLLELAWSVPPPTPGFVLRQTFERVFSDRVEEKRGLLAWLDEMRRDPIPDWELPQPTLLVWGENDPLFPLSVAHRLEAAIEHAELVVIPKARHAPNLEHPGPFNKALLDFLKR